MSTRLIFFLGCFFISTSFQAIAGLRLQDGEYSFCSKSTNKVAITRLLANGKELLTCGILNPDGNASISDERMFPYTLPSVFQIEYRDVGGITRTDKLETAWIKIKKARDGKINFVFTPEQKFVLKIYLPANDDDTGMRLDGLLLPDEDNPVFKSYKELVRAAIDGKTQRVQELLSNGVPYIWPNVPEELSPFGWSVRWNRQETFDFLIKQMPKDFYPYEYYWCIRMAAQDGHTNILKRLLQSDLAQDIPKASLQDIFYTACYHATTNDVEVVKILLEHFKVGIDYKTRDFGHTLLFVAVDSDDMELAKWLLAQGANPNAKLEDGSTPLNFSRSSAMGKLLVSYGAR